MRRAYFRCNSGHYFHGHSCPYDGWTSPELTTLLSSSLLQGEEESTLSIENLRRSGINEYALRRTIIVEFGSADSSFDAVAPESYVVGRKYMTMLELGSAFK